MDLVNNENSEVSGVLAAKNESGYYVGCLIFTYQQIDHDRLNGSLNGSEYNHNNEFAYAYFRDEMKAKNLNPDINIEQEDNQNNPHLQQHTDANDKFLGLSNRSEDNVSLAREFNDQFCCDVIGTSYCRSRAIACTKDEFLEMENLS